MPQQPMFYNNQAPEGPQAYGGPAQIVGNDPSTWSPTGYGGYQGWNPYQMYGGMGYGGGYGGWNPYQMFSPYMFGGFGNYFGGW